MESSPKHHQNSRGGFASTPPTNAQETLKGSILIKPTTSRRVGVDKRTGEFAVFDETHNGSGIYHGHIRKWEDLTQEMKNALLNSGVVNKKGKIL
ncbi:MAG: hypothetical protein U0Z75_09095 [Deinococcaceae bacterium]